MRAAPSVPLERNAGHVASQDTAEPGMRANKPTTMSSGEPTAAVTTAVGKDSAELREKCASGEPTAAVGKRRAS
jgi:hypothetical protein